MGCHPKICMGDDTINSPSYIVYLSFVSFHFMQLLSIHQFNKCPVLSIVVVDEMIQCHILWRVNEKKYGNNCNMGQDMEAFPTKPVPVQFPCHANQNVDRQASMNGIKACQLENCSPGGGVLKANRGGSTSLTGESYHDQQYCWRDCLDPSFRHTEWTCLEDNELLRLMKKYGSGHWRQVAEELPRRRSFWDIQRRYRLLCRVRL